MKRKLLSLLVLLMTAATGAWAQGVDPDYNIHVDFNPYYNPNFTQFHCDIMMIPEGDHLKVLSTYTSIVI